MLIKITYVEQREYTTEVEANSYTDAENIVTELVKENPNLPSVRNSACYID